MMSDLADEVGELIFTGRIRPTFFTLLERVYNEYPELEKFLDLILEETIIILRHILQTNKVDFEHTKRLDVPKKT